MAKQPAHDLPEVEDDGFLGTGVKFTAPKLQVFSVKLERLRVLTVEAFSAPEAFGIYCKQMGILNSVHQPAIHVVTDEGVVADVRYQTER